MKQITEQLFHTLQEKEWIEEGKEEEPFVYLWLVLLLAQIEDYQQRNTMKATF